MGDEGSRVAIFAALGANLGIAVSKFVAFGVTGSSSMLAEGVHSVADTGNELLLLLGGRRAARAPSRSHPFGYGRYRYLYPFLVALSIFLIGGVFALYEGVRKLVTPEPVENPVWAFGVLGVAIVLESVSLRTALRESARARGDRGLREFIHRAKAPDLVVVLLEDMGALFGLGLALCGVAMASATGDGRWDGAGTAAIGVLLVSVAVVLATETRDLLLGEAADEEVVAAIERALGAGPGLGRVIHLRTMHLGPEELLVAAKVAVDGAAPAARVAEAIDSAEAAVRAAVPYRCAIYLEPDVDRSAAQADG